MNLFNAKSLTFSKRSDRQRFFLAVMRKARCIDRNIVVEEIKGVKSPILISFRLSINDKRYIEYFYKLLKNLNVGKFDFEYKVGKVFFVMKDCEVTSIIAERKRPKFDVTTFKVALSCTDIAYKSIMQVRSEDHYLCPEYRIPIGYKTVYKLK